MKVALPNRPLLVLPPCLSKEVILSKSGASPTLGIPFFQDSPLLPTCSVTPFFVVSPLKDSLERLLVRLSPVEIEPAPPPVVERARSRLFLEVPSLTAGLKTSSPQQAPTGCSQGSLFPGTGTRPRARRSPPPPASTGCPPLVSWRCACAEPGLAGSYSPDSLACELLSSGGPGGPGVPSAGAPVSRGVHSAPRPVKRRAESALASGLPCIRSRRRLHLFRSLSLRRYNDGELRPV